jgi:hypothetical protein
VAGVSLDLMGRWIVQLFHHNNIGGFSPVVFRKWQVQHMSVYFISPRATPCTLENQRDQHIQSIESKKFQQILISQRILESSMKKL